MSTKLQEQLDGFQKAEMEVEALRATLILERERSAKPRVNVSCAALASTPQTERSSNILMQMAEWHAVAERTDKVSCAGRWTLGCRVIFCVCMYRDEE